MKSIHILAVVALATVPSHASQANPIEKVVEMISQLQQKSIAAAADSQKAYDKYAEWCEDRSRGLSNEIKTGKAEVAESKANIESESSEIGALEAKIEELSGDIQTDESDLNAATGIRKKEAADFEAEEKELNEVLSMLERATSILARESKNGGASMLQLKGAKSLTDALSVMVQGMGLSSADASRLTALVQTGQQAGDADSDSDADMEAPAASAYDSHSEGIIGTLEGLSEKAQGQLEKARKTERTNVQNYEMLKQSLTNAMELAKHDMAKAKRDKAESQEKKAIAEGDLHVASVDLAEDVKTKKTLHQDCLNAAQEFELATKSRSEELNALAAAKKAIADSTGGAEKQTYGLNQESFLQLTRTRLSSSADVSKFHVVRFVRGLARKTKSSALAQLASRISSAVKLGSTAGGDPFAKVKSLITDMISALEDDAATEASHKAYCDKELAATTGKKDDLTTSSDSLSTKIAQATAASKKLKEQVATLQNELASMAKARAEAEQLRGMEKAAHEKNSAEMKEGIKGIKMALRVLKEYYARNDQAHEADQGGGSGIIGLLEVCESDFSKGLTEMNAEEESAVFTYEQYKKEDQVATTLKEKDAKYKTKEAAALDKAVTDLSADYGSVSDELAAVNSGLERLKDMCVAKAMPYSERKARREAELVGLDQALQIIDGSAVLLQEATKHTLRGVHSKRTTQHSTLSA